MHSPRLKCLRTFRLLLNIDDFAVLTELAVVYELSLAQLDELEAAVSALFRPGLGIPKVRACHHCVSMP